MRALWAWVAIGLSVAGGSTPTLADPITLTHTGWEVYHAGIVPLAGPPDQHGAPVEYGNAPAIPNPGPDWKPLTGGQSDVRNPFNIDFLGPNDDYSSNLRSCQTQADFWYFQTTVSVPKGFRVATAQLVIGPLDDGARYVIFNSQHPGGFTPDDGYVLLGENKTLSLNPYLVPGETNRIVIQHIDDCAAQGWLGTVDLSVTGDGTQTAGAQTWGTVKVKYR
jgi:hypothetical protein